MDKDMLSLDANKIGFIGLGQCGGNICDVAEYYGYDTIVFNTSPEDLESMSIVKNKKLLGINGGAGKDRRESKSEVKKAYKDIIEEVENVLSDKKLIYVVFSTGGGTGSGIGPMVSDMLQKVYPNINFSVMAILPSLDETVVSQVNTMECLKEIYALNLPTMLIDNEKYKSSKNYTRKKLFDVINTKAILNISSLFIKNRIPSKYGNVDQKDLMKLLTTPGNIIINEIIFNKVDFLDKGLTKTLMEAIEDNIYTDIQFDDVIKRSGYIFEIEEELTTTINMLDVDKKFGKPLEVFEGYYRNNDVNSIISVMSGLSYPENRIKLISNVLEESKEKVGKFNVSEILESEVKNQWFDEKRDDNKKDDTEIDLESLLSKY